MCSFKAENEDYGRPLSSVDQVLPVGAGAILRTFVVRFLKQNKSSTLHVTTRNENSVRFSIASVSTSGRFYKINFNFSSITWEERKTTYSQGSRAVFCYWLKISSGFKFLNSFNDRVSLHSGYNFLISVLFLVDADARTLKVSSASSWSIASTTSLFTTSYVYYPNSFEGKLHGDIIQKRLITALFGWVVLVEKHSRITKDIMHVFFYYPSLIWRHVP